MLTEHVPGTYAMHDLLRRYASELAHLQEPGADRMAALTRTRDHYLHTASAGSRILNPDHKPVTLTPCRPGVGPEALDDYHQALAWFSAEHAVLLASISQAVSHRFDVQAYQLVRSVAAYLRIRGH